MDFPFRSDSSTSATSSDGYFAAQARHAGMIGLGWDSQKGNLVPPLPPFSVMEREMLKERIREEILTREMAERRILEEEIKRERLRKEMIAREMEERRILEEEVKRELELERMMGVRDFGEDRFTEPMFDRAMQVMPEMRYRGRFGLDRLSHSHKVGFDERFTRPLEGKVRDGKSLPFPLGLSKERIIEPSSEMETKPSKLKLCGTKRKAAADGGAKGPLPLAQAWGCALCEVSCTSKERLEEHLQGKKHKAKAAELAGSKTGIIRNSYSASAQAEVGGLAGGKPASGLKKVSSNAKKKQQQKKSLRCELCKVECNSTAMLAAHFGGKKHNAQWELQKKRGAREEAKKMQNGNKLMPDTIAGDAKGVNQENEGVKEEKNEGVKEEKNEGVKEEKNQPSE